MHITEYIRPVEEWIFLSAVKLTETATLSQLFSYVIDSLDVLSQRDIALCTERRQNIFHL